MRWYFASPVLVSAAALLVVLLEPDPDPSSELLRTMSGIGVSLFLAYVIEATWLAQKVNLKTDDESEVFLEVITGIAVCGLMSIGLMLILSEHPAKAPFLWVDIYFFWWSSISLFVLGFLVAVQPALAHELGRGSAKTEKDDRGT